MPEATPVTVRAPVAVRAEALKIPAKSNTTQHTVTYVIPSIHTSIQVTNIYLHGCCPLLDKPEEEMVFTEELTVPTARVSTYDWFLLPLS